MLKLGKDINGNKTLKYITGTSEKGFSVQTNGSLIETNRMSHYKGALYQFDYDVAYNELRSFIKLYGTDRQKRLLNLSIS